jgi:cytochrome c oxidase subunit 2
VRKDHPLARMLAIGAVASVVGVGLALLLDWFPHQASTAASDIDTLYYVLLAVSVPIFVLVMTVAIYSVVRFRARHGDQSDGAPIHGNTRLEIVWVAVPFVIVTVLAVYAWIVLDDIEEPQPGTMQVEVRGQQFAWSFRYRGPEGRPVTTEQLVLPVNRPVKFNIRARDVIHSFWVPDFRLKQDAVPGITTTTRLTPNRVGTYDVVCAELCGIGHSTMRQTVRVVEQGQFAAWLDRGGRGPVPATAPALGARGGPAGGGG